MVRFLRCVSLLGILCFATGGCWEKEKSAADHFREAQGKVVTPHGKIKKDSVKAVDGDHIQYETDQGSVFRVRAEKGKDGYRYSDPEKIK